MESNLSTREVQLDASDLQFFDWYALVE